ALAFAMDALGPGPAQALAAAPTMHALFALLERRVPGHGPARVVVRIGVRAAPFVIVLHVLFEGRLHAVDHERFVIEAVQSAFAAATVVSAEHDEGVVVLADTLESGDHATDLLVGLRHLPGKNFHLARVEFFLRGVQAIPAGNLRDAVGELGAGGEELYLHLLREDHLSRLVPAHVELALIHVDVLLLHLMWGMHRTRRPE